MTLGCVVGPIGCGLVPPSPSLIIKDKVTKTSQILVEAHLIDVQFRKAWMPYFCRLLVRIFKRSLGQRCRRLVAWNEIKSFPLACFSGLAILLTLVETSAVSPQGLLDAYIAMIPGVDGDSTPLGQRPLCVLFFFEGLWASLRLTHLKDWVPQFVFISSWQWGVVS